MSLTIHNGDCREELLLMKSKSVQCCITSPPYFGLRCYGHEKQIGKEKTPEAFVAELVSVFREVKRVLRDDGTLWLNLGDSYAANRTYQVPSTKGGPKHSPAQGDCGSSKVPEGLKPKDLIGIPWMVAFALRADGWYLRQDIIWSKPNPMPESVRDRCTKAHEYIFMLSKSEKYYFDADTIAEPAKYKNIKGMDGSGFKPPQNFKGKPANGSETLPVRKNVIGEHDGKRNKRSVWHVATRPYKGSHFATFPPDLIRPCVLAGSKTGDMVLDPFGGSGTTGQVALELGRDATLIELNPDYVDLIHKRTGYTPMSDPIFN